MIAMLAALLLLADPAHEAPPFRATGCSIVRDDSGKILRSQTAKSAFRSRHACPATGKKHGPCPGWILDHVWPLCAGGCDTPANLQWQAADESKQKDVLERHLCGVHRPPFQRSDPESVRRARCALKVDPTVPCGPEKGDSIDWREVERAVLAAAKRTDEDLREEIRAVVAANRLEFERLHAAEIRALRP